jgi:hypothetical protein
MGFILIIMIKSFILLAVVLAIQSATPPIESTQQQKTLNFGCQFCHTIVEGIRHAPKQPLLRALEIISTQYCIHKKLQIKHVCQGAVKEMTQYILASAWDHAIDPHSLCHKIKVVVVTCSSAHRSINCSLSPITLLE